MTSNKFINAEIPVANKHEAELAAKKAEELGYSLDSRCEYADGDNYLTLFKKGTYGFYTDRATILKVIPFSDFLDQFHTKTITLENGEKWRVQLIEKVEEEPMSAEEFFHSKVGDGNAPQWMEAYAQYRLECEREKANQQQ